MVTPLLGDDHLSLKGTHVNELFVCLQMVPPRGRAYVVMVHRRDASKVLVTLKNARIHGNSLKVCSN